MTEVTWLILGLIVGVVPGFAAGYLTVCIVVMSAVNKGELKWTRLPWSSRATSCGCCEMCRAAKRMRDMLDETRPAGK